VKEQMGHSSIQVTVDTYGHLSARTKIPYMTRFGFLAYLPAVVCCCAAIALSTQIDNGSDTTQNGVVRTQPASAAVVTQDLTKRNVTELRSLADHGSRSALTQLGRVYELGIQGASVDLQASIGFYKQASELGDSDASYRVGAIYYSGREGVPKDDAQAVSWCRKAVDAGNAEGMDRLGFMLRHGRPSSWGNRESSRTIVVECSDCPTWDCGRSCVRCNLRDLAEGVLSAITWL